MGRIIIKAVIAGPNLSQDIIGATPSEAAGRVLSEAEQTGLTLFLTAVSREQIAGTREWFQSLPPGAKRDNVRVLSPGRFFWSRGSLRLPFETQRPSTALEAAKGEIEKLVVEASPKAQVIYDEADESLTAVGSEPIDDALLEGIWNVANAEKLTLGDPQAGFETEQDPKARWTAVIAPGSTSELWFEAITRIERLDPSTVLVLEAGQAGPIISTVQAKLKNASKALAAGSVELVEDAAEAAPIATTFPANAAVAPRISAPSAVHFIHQWSEANRKYVRESYWQASKLAQANLSNAKGLLTKLPSQRYARAGLLVDLAGKIDGAQLLDDFSGAVCFAPGFYEFDLGTKTGVAQVDAMVANLNTYLDKRLDNMPFDRPLLRRRLYSNSLVLLRGQGYYSNLRQTPPWDRAKEFVGEASDLEALARSLLKKPQDLAKAVRACLDGGDKTQAAWKMLLAVLDQARNLGLIMLSVAMHLWRGSDNTWDEKELVKNATKVVEDYYSVMLGDVTIDGLAIIQRVRDFATKAASELTHLAATENERAQNADWYEPGRPIRGWREADNPFENLLVGLLAADTIAAGDKPAAAFGLFWGGVELPIATKVASQALGREIGVFGFISLGHYSGSAAKDEGFYCDLSTGAFADFNDLVTSSPSKLLLLDDNALSGQTLESARDLLLGVGLDNISTWVVRFSGERREGQMRMANSGIVHPSYLNLRLQGFLGETPYARSYSRKQYENPVGVFNVARSRILRYLHSNGFASIFEREGF